MISKQDEIRKCCWEIERQYKVNILFAVENGSRAWKLSSEDSDYDVRFVYTRDFREYLKISKPRDVITLEKGDIDLVGFDLFKFCGLLKASNPTAIEWLSSDIVYTGNRPLFLKHFARDNFNPKALFWHYQSMCKNNYLKYLKGGHLVTYKKYLYAMRGLLNARYVKANLKIPPISFPETIENLKGDIPITIYKKLLDIIEKKKSCKEKDIIQNEVRLDTYIESELKKASEDFCIKKTQLDGKLNDFILGQLRSEYD